MPPSKKSSHYMKPSEELDLFHKITDIIGSSLDLKTILQEVISLVSKVTKADACFLYLYEPDESSLVLSASKTPHAQEIGHIRLKMGEGLTGWVAQHHKPLAIAQRAHQDHRFKFFQSLPEDKYEAFLSVPIQIRQKVVGVINVQHRKQHKYPDQTLLTLSTIGRQTGKAIENARLFEETKRRSQTLETLSAVSHTVTSSPFLDDILQKIVSMTASLLKSKICSVMLLDDKKNELHIAATQSMSDSYRNKPPVKIKDSVSGQAILKKAPVLVPDVRQDKRYSFPDIAHSEELKAMLSVPMMFKDKPIGVINSYSDSFNKEDISFLQTVANQCASAIENTVLLKEKLEAQEALETRKVVERAKNILMKNNAISEPEAFKRIQKQSMDRRKPVKEIAEAILLANDMNKDQTP